MAVGAFAISVSNAPSATGRHKAARTVRHAQQRVPDRLEFPQLIGALDFVDFVHCRHTV